VVQIDPCLRDAHQRDNVVYWKTKRKIYYRWRAYLVFFSKVLSCAQSRDQSAPVYQSGCSEAPSLESIGLVNSRKGHILAITLWVLADKQTRNYYALIGAEEEIGSEAFTSPGVELARSLLTRTLLARPSFMALPHAYTYPCTVQLHRRVVKLASSCPLPNDSCTALHMPYNAHPPAPHSLAPLSMWMLVHPASRHLLAGAYGEGDVVSSVRSKQ